MRPICDHASGQCREVAFRSLCLSEETPSSTDGSSSDAIASTITENEESAGVEALEALLNSHSGSASASSSQVSSLYSPSVDEALVRAHQQELPLEHRSKEATAEPVLQSAEAMHYGLLALGARFDGFLAEADSYILRCRAAVSRCWDTSNPYAASNLVSALLCLSVYSQGVLRRCMDKMAGMPDAHRQLGTPDTYLSLAQRLAATLTIDDCASRETQHGAGQSSEAASSSSSSAPPTASGRGTLPFTVADTLCEMLEEESRIQAAFRQRPPQAPAPGTSEGSFTVAEPAHPLSIGGAATAHGRAFRSIQRVARVTFNGVFDQSSHPSNASEFPRLLDSLRETQALIQTHDVAKGLSFAPHAKIELMRALLLRRLGRSDEARASLLKAIALLEAPARRFAVGWCTPELVQGVTLLAPGDAATYNRLRKVIGDLGLVWPGAQAALQLADSFYTATMAAAKPTREGPSVPATGSEQTQSAGPAPRNTLPTLLDFDIAVAVIPGLATSPFRQGHVSLSVPARAQSSILGASALPRAVSLSSPCFSFPPFGRPAGQLGTGNSCPDGDASSMLQLHLALIDDKLDLSQG